MTIDLQQTLQNIEQSEFSETTKQKVRDVLADTEYSSEEAQMAVIDILGQEIEQEAADMDLQGAPDKEEIRLAKEVLRAQIDVEQGLQELRK